VTMDDFNILSVPREAKFDSLREEFNALFARMQSAKSRAAMEVAFSASPEDLGKAAVSAARSMQRTKTIVGRCDRLKV
jgi:hypothetical protein